MVDISGAIGQMTVLVLIAAIGFVATKARILDADLSRRLTRLLLDVTLPAMILASVGSMDAASAGAQVGWAFLLATAQFFLLLATGSLCNVLLRVPREQRSSYLFMSVCTNTGFVGLPVVSAVYGSSSVMLSSIFIMVIAFFLYSVGFGVLASGGGEHASRGLSAIPWRAMANPSMFASVIAIALFFCGVRYPTVISTTLGMVGGITAPVAMMIVGQIIASASLGDVVREWRLYPYIVIRMLAVPTLLFFVLRAFVPEMLCVGVFVIMFAMPVGSMAASFVTEMGGDPSLPAKGTILSTIASFVIVPVLAIIMTSL